ncbi:MAG TPA: tRNA 2-thiouridine(34) synthase MnmA [Kiritimatiellia bacterium]|nr:tRNA 2-thiouridine(34) synthase MnmA [Kiritimatiellia bacterium]
MEIPPPEPGNGRHVAIGMSGGIDSSVAAALLLEQGWNVIGFTLHMFKEGSRCCSIEDVNRARRICDKLGIRHYVLNVMDRFRDEVIAPFAAAYAQGRTPNPCIFCNRHFKFGALLERARQLDCTHIATGHYVGKEHTPSGYRLIQGRDPTKDQSYFLHRLTPDQVEHAVFPLGSWLKTDVRAYAREHDLPTDGARETADLCFITGKGPAPLIETFHPEVRRAGPILDTSGRKLGEHQGIHHFTIGQRGGLGIAAGRRVYVKQLDPTQNTVTVADRADLYTRTFIVKDLYWMAGPPHPDTPLTVRTRYRQQPVPVTLTLNSDPTATLHAHEPIFAVTPGQAAVLYHGPAVLGGGWIESILP